MKKLDIPKYKTSDIIELCAKKLTKKKDLAKRLRAAKLEFEEKEDEYIELGKAAKLFNLAEAENFEKITSLEMKHLYDRSFVPHESTRPIYNAILQSAPRNICPLCNQRTVGTLDHHLSKAHHPAFAVTPANLVPACRECNEGTGARRPKLSKDQTLHPYFDNVDTEIWLKAEIVESDDPAVRFFVGNVASWPAPKQLILENHFRVFGLGTLYSTHAAVEVSGLRGELRRMQKKSSVQEISEELKFRATSRSDDQLNTWQGALYLAASDSDWFCSGGYEKFVIATP